MIKAKIQNSRPDPKVLFVTYDSIKAPLLYSQGIPLLREIAKRGYKPAIVTFEYGRLEDEKFYKDLMHEYNIKWFKIRHCKFYIGPKSSFDILKGIIKVFLIVLKYNYAIIHCRSYIAGFIGLVIAKLLRKKHIFDMRGLYPDEYVLSGYIKKNSKIYRFYKFIEFLQIKYSDKVIVTSKRFSSYILRLYNKKVKKLLDKVFIIYNSADLNKFRYNEKVRNEMRKKLNIEDKIVFVYSGSLAKWHLWKKAVKYFEILSKETEKYFFLFLTYEKNDRVNEIFNKYKIPPQKYKILSVEPNNISYYIISSDIALMFIIGDISKQIASPVKFGEFLGCGLPVIANSGLMDVAEFINGNKIGIVYNDEELKNEEIIREKFKVFMKSYDKNLKDRCVKVAKENFNLNDAITKYLKIYNKL